MAHTMKTNKHPILLYLCLIFPVFLYAQTDLSLDLTEYHDLEIRYDNGHYQILTTGNDPYIFTKRFSHALATDEVILSFEYFCPKGLDHFQAFFKPKENPGFNKTVRPVAPSEGWVQFSVDLGDVPDTWGEAGDRLRMDFGARTGVELQIRNLKMRKRTVREVELLATKQERLENDRILEKNLKDYLSKVFTSKIEEVIVTEKTVQINGVNESGRGIFLAEVSPDVDLTESQEFPFSAPVEHGSFHLEFPRKVKRNNRTYDRILSKWVLLKKQEKPIASRQARRDTPAKRSDSTQASGNRTHAWDSKPRIVSHAKYPTRISALYDSPEEKPASKKGLGGFGIGRGHVEDLDDLDIASVTVNIWVSRFMFTEPGEDRIAHTYNGKKWYFGEKQVNGLDKTFQATAERGIITAAILLVSKAEQCPDKEIGRLLQHPDMDPAGIYSMPNMTTPESVECYAAALDFLASRYSRADKKYGRIHYWIMHNEVETGWNWTNMGQKTALVFMDTYLKSMRMCYAIARGYNPHSEVFISLAHRWTRKHGPNFYQGKDLMDLLLEYTKAEGDFEWGIAYHPYPENLFEPKTWLDKNVDFTFETPLITFKNLEVLDAYVKQPDLLYKGKKKRTLWLSENGTNSRTYSEKDLFEQAAGFAYTWKKLEGLDGIDGFQWHNWTDLRSEGGLRLGLRKYPDDEKDPGGRKPVWYVYQAAGRSNEDDVFEPFKELMGIESWEDVKYKGKIKSKNK